MSRTRWANVGCLALTPEDLRPARVKLGMILEDHTRILGQLTPQPELPNGKIVERSGPHGPGRLQIKNGTSSDVAISVVTDSPSNPQAMICVHEESSATITGIPGSYQVNFKTGSGWDASGRRFTSGCAYEKFEQTFDQRSDWSIDLRKSTLGNAKTGSVPPY